MQEYEKCNKCGQETLEDDFSYISLGDMTFRVWVYYCSNCGFYEVETTLLTKEDMKRRSKSKMVAELFGLEVQ